MAEIFDKIVHNEILTKVMKIVTRNIGLSGTDKVIRVGKLGKKTVLEEITLDTFHAKARNKVFMTILPILVPFMMSITFVPPTLETKMSVENISSFDNQFLNMLAATPNYVSTALMVAIGIIGLMAGFKLMKSLIQTETSNIFLSSAEKEKINNDQKYKRIVVDEDLTKNSAGSIAQRFIEQAYPEIAVENRSEKLSKNIDRSFSNIFNQNAA